MPSTERTTTRTRLGFIGLGYLGSRIARRLATAGLSSSALSSSLTARERIAAMPEDDWPKHDANFQEPLLSRNLQLVEALRAVGQRQNARPGEVAIAWTLQNPAVTGAIVGIRSAQQAKGISSAAALELTSSEIAEIECRMVPEAA